MISVIIPFLDEERALGPTLASLLACTGSFEVIAVDGGSTDRSRDVLQRHPGVRVIDAERGRAQQMNAGARIAQGELLVFLHADTILPPGAVPALAAQMDDPRFQWGGFRHRFSGAARSLRLISWLHNARCRLTGVFYGDQALFVRRDLFERVHGYPVERMEDVALSQQLLRIARPTRLDPAIITDSRKFERMGIWTSLSRVLTIRACAQLGWRYPTAFFSDIR